MPTVFREQGFRFHFFSNEGSPREPVHVHVARGGAKAKFWLRPSVRLADFEGFDRRTLGAIERIVTARAAEIEERWNAHFGDGGMLR